MRGFTLVEALVAVMVSFLIAVGIAGMITSFGLFTRDNVLYTCLLNAASSAIEACKGGQAISQVNCGSYTVSVGLSGNCMPAQGQCSQVSATATARNKSTSLTDMICNVQ